MRKELPALKAEIGKLLSGRNAILLAHNYQRDEVQEIADITGDSLGLSQEAAKTAADSPASPCRAAFSSLARAAASAADER